MSASAPWATGLVVVDDFKHAVLRKWLRNVALCGAGRIVVHRGEEFDPHAPLACPQCRSLIRSGSGQ